jgi:hypothetical protein
MKINEIEGSRASRAEGKSLSRLEHCSWLLPCLLKLHHLLLHFGQHPLPPFAVAEFSSSLPFAVPVRAQSARRSMATCAQAMSGHKAPITADDLMPALVSTIAEALDLDPAIALDMGMPLMLDDESMTTFIKDEIVANADHVLALKAQEQMRRDPGTDMTPITDKDSFLTTQLTLISKMVALCVSEPASIPFMPDDLRKKEITGEGYQSDRCHTCTACMDSKAWFEVHAADCKHEYCEDCLRRLFEDSYKDESLFPPRCCQKPFPVENNASLTVHLPLDLVSRWPLRKIEVNTKDRTYCHKCGTFILPATIMNNRAKCGTCDIDTCSKCKKPYHFFGCLVDVAEQQVIELARKEGWQRCTGCRGMVELKKGCHHMT